MSRCFDSRHCTLIIQSYSGRVIRSGLARYEHTMRSHFNEPPPLTPVQFRARNWGGSQGQVSRARLAVQIAKRTAEFIAVRLSAFPLTDEEH